LVELKNLIVTERRGWREVDQPNVGSEEARQSNEVRKTAEGSPQGVAKRKQPGASESKKTEKNLGRVGSPSGSKPQTQSAEYPNQKGTPREKFLESPSLCHLHQPRVRMFKSNDLVSFTQASILQNSLELATFLFVFMVKLEICVTKQRSPR